MAESPQNLQFQKVEPLPDASMRRCVACAAPIASTYYHAQGQVVCPTCAQRIHVGQQAPPAISLAKAALYGAAAALLGCILYAAVAIILNLEIGIIAIVVGIMVGRAVRKGSNGLGGRPQQILAVVLTYFAITTSYIPVYIYQSEKHPVSHQQSGARSAGPADQQAADLDANPAPKMSVAAAMLGMLLIFAAAPFLALSNGVGALVSLFIIFIGLKQAWSLTGRRQVLVMGPYQETA
jgi:hypothetical protein